MERVASRRAMGRARTARTPLTCALAARTLATCTLAACTLAAPAHAAVRDAGGGAFDRTADADVLTLVDEGDREALAEALEDAGRNWTELAEAVAELEGDERDACVWLILGMPHLDRLEMTARTLTEHVELAFRAKREMPYGVPDEMFEPYILTYRIEEEPVEPWRGELYERFRAMATREADAVSVARAINIELARSLEEREWGFYGPRQSPLLTLKSGSGSQAEIAILACAALKAVGIPSRQAGVRALAAEDEGAHWIEIYDGAEWLPLFPLEPNAFGDFGYLEREHTSNVTVVSSRSSFERVLVTERYTETGTVELSFVDDGAAASGFEHFALAVLNRGSLVPLDSLEAVADDDGRFAAVVGEGRYVVTAGVRDADGNPFVMMQQVTVVPGGRVAVAFDVTPRGEVTGIDPASLADLGAVVRVVYLFDPDHEPSTRMLPLVAGTVRRASGTAELICAHRGHGSEHELRALAGPAADVRSLPSDARYVQDASGHRTPFPQEGEELPLVRAYLISTGEPVLEHRGYDLNIARRLGAAIDEALAELIGQSAGN